MYKTNYRMDCIEMSGEEAAAALCVNSERAKAILQEFARMNDTYGKLFYLDHYDIYDDDIYKLFKFGCDENFGKLKLFIILLGKERYFTIDEVKANLSQEKPISFFDRKIKFDLKTLINNNYFDLIDYHYKNDSNYKLLVNSFRQRYAKTFGKTSAQPGSEE